MQRREEVQHDTILTRLIALNKLKRDISNRIKDAATYAVDVNEEQLTYENIKARISTLAQQISATYADEDPPVIISKMGNAMPFVSALQLELSMQEFDFEYASITINVSGFGNLVIKPASHTSVAGKQVIIVEDVIDTEDSFARMKEYALNQGAVDVGLAVLIDKMQETDVDYPEKIFKGFVVNPELTIIGFGLDYVGCCQNMLDIKVVAEESMLTEKEEEALGTIPILNRYLSEKLVASRSDGNSRVNVRGSLFREISGESDSDEDAKSNATDEYGQSSARYR